MLSSSPASSDQGGCDLGGGHHSLRRLWMQNRNRHGLGESNLETWICKYCSDKHLHASGGRAWRPAWCRSAATRVSPKSLRRGPTFPRPANGLSLRRWANVATARDANKCHGVPVGGTVSPVRKPSPWGDQTTPSAVRASIGDSNPLLGLSIREPARLPD
jgi:hypothetical protein